jgi:hypothetical protein
MRHVSVLAWRPLVCAERTRADLEREQASRVNHRNVVGHMPASPDHPVNACMNGTKKIVITDFPSMPVANHEQSGLKRKVYRDHTIPTISMEIARAFLFRTWSATDMSSVQALRLYGCTRNGSCKVHGSPGPLRLGAPKTTESQGGVYK